MKQGFRQSMAWLHTWAGLLLGWLLYLIFVTGTAGYLDTEIDRWMRPEAPAASTNVDSASAAQTGVAWLRREVSNGRRWSLSLPADRNSPYLYLFWQDADGVRDNTRIDLATGEPFTVRDTGGGQTLYQMHWRLHYLPGSITDWLISLATLFMLVAMVTGIIVHKKIFKDFFTFRSGKGQRSWLDAHNALSVLTMPFQLMITYSGLIFMMFSCMPLIINAVYGFDDGSRDRFFDEAFPSSAVGAPAGKPAELIKLAGPLAEARRRWGSDGISRLSVHHPGDANARIRLRGPDARQPMGDPPELVFDGRTGELLAAYGPETTVIDATRDAFLGLHEGLFAGPFVRVLYLVSGLLGTGMVATGLVLWTVKRREKLAKTRSGSPRGLVLVERLNIGTVVGLPVGIAAYFWANRLLPPDFVGRAAWEVHAMFIAWALMLTHAAARPRARAWIEQLWIAAAAFALVPMVNALTTDRHLLNSLPAGDWIMAGFDLAMLGIGLATAAAALFVGRRIATANPARLKSAFDHFSPEEART